MEKIIKVEWDKNGRLKIKDTNIILAFARKDISESSEYISLFTLPRAEGALLVSRAKCNTIEAAKQVAEEDFGVESL